MPRTRNDASGKEEPQPDAPQKEEVRSVRVNELKVNESSTEDKEEVSNSNQATKPPIQDTTDQKKPTQIKLPNFLGLQMDNFANYLGSGQNTNVAPRSHSFGRQLDQMNRTQQGSTRNRVQSLDRENRDESSTVTFLSPRERNANNVGALYQRANPYQQGSRYNDQPSEASTAAGESEQEHSSIGKTAECQIG